MILRNAKTLLDPEDEGTAILRYVKAFREVKIKAKQDVEKSIL
jgi:hypothetical protein